MVWKENAPENPTQKPLKFTGGVTSAAVLPPAAPTCPLEEASLNGSGIQSGGGYRTYHMDEYDEDKTPSVRDAPWPHWDPGELGRAPYLER